MIQDVEGFSRKQKLDSKEILRLSLSIEESLLRWQEKFGEDKKSTLLVSKVFNRLTFSIGVKGETFDPREDDEKELTYFSSIISNGSSYAYKKGRNLLAFTTIWPSSFFLSSMIIAVVLGIALGLLGKLLSKEFLFYPQYIVQKASDTVLGLLTLFVVPVVVFVDYFATAIKVGMLEVESAIIGKKLNLIEE